MSIFFEQIAFIDDFQEKLFNTFQDVVNQFGFVIRDFVVNKQLFQKGIDGKGERLPGYQRTTIRIKLGKGQPVDRTTLHDTEKFVGSIVVDAFQDRFEISSNVSYDKYIIRRFGLDILRPTNENFEEFMINFFLPKLKDNVNN